MLTKNRSILLMKITYWFEAYIVEIYTYLNYHHHISIWVCKPLYSNNGIELTSTDKFYMVIIFLKSIWILVKLTKRNVYNYLNIYPKWTLKYKIL